MTKENAIIGELRVKANLVKVDISGLKRGTILWITKPRGYSIFITLSVMDQARAGDVLRKLDLPAGRDDSWGVRQNFDDLKKAGFLEFEQGGDTMDKYYKVTDLGKRLASACAMLIDSLEKQSMEKIKNEGWHLALLDLVRDFAQPGVDPHDLRVGEIPEFHHPRLNSVKEKINSRRRIAGNGDSRNDTEKQGLNPPVPATRPEEIKRYNARDGNLW